VYTAHNVNMKTRDGGDGILNRITLRFLYWIMDDIFVHTKAMKDELIKEFSVRDEKVTVIPFGINNTVLATDLDFSRARDSLNLANDDIALLFFGYIALYRGLNILVDALNKVVAKVQDVKLIIAGRVKGSDGYWKGINRKISK
jgi:glycosyltransferase involved in cell wall biosynthesis